MKYCFLALLLALCAGCRPTRPVAGPPASAAHECDPRTRHAEPAPSRVR